MVSVIIPVYNAEKTLAACVRSILNQSFRRFELILVDDGSTDGSGQICDEVQKNCALQNIPCQVIHQKNTGVSSARNCGMDHANGDYFVCVDSDDVVESCYLEDLVQTSETHPEFGLVLCGFRCTAPARDYVLTRKEPLSVVTRRNYMRLFQSVLIQGPCLLLYRTEIVRKNGLKMREDLSLAEDLTFNLEYLDILGETPIGVVNKPNYVYQNDDQNSLFRKYRPDLLAINEMIIHSVRQYLTRWNVSDESAWQSFYSAAFYKYVSVLDNTFSKSNKMKTRGKIKYNNSIMRKPAFREALGKGGIHMIPSYRLAYSSGHYRLVLAAKAWEKTKIRFHQLITLFNMKNIKNFFSRVRNKLWNIRLAGYLRLKRLRLKNHDFSILSVNCVGGVMSHDLHERFNSPTVNLWFKPADFLVFLNDLDHFLNCEITEAHEDGISYPVGRMSYDEGFITVYFTHYPSFSEAVKKWRERAQRVRKDKLFVVFEYPAVDASPEEQEEIKRRFDALPYQNKIMITKPSGPSGDNIVHMNVYDDAFFPGKLLSRKGKWSVRRYLDDYDYVSYLNNGL